MSPAAAHETIRSSFTHSHAVVMREGSTWLASVVTEGRRREAWYTAVYLGSKLRDREGTQRVAERDSRGSE